MNDCYKVVNEDFRFTFPQTVREKADLKPNDIISLSVMENGAIVISKVKICDNCRSANAEQRALRDKRINNFISELSETEKKKLTAALSAEWAAKQGGDYLA